MASCCNMHLMHAPRISKICHLNRFHMLLISLFSVSPSPLRPCRQWLCSRGGPLRWFRRPGIQTVWTAHVCASSTPCQILSRYSMDFTQKIQKGQKTRHLKNGWLGLLKISADFGLTSSKRKQTDGLQQGGISRRKGRKNLHNPSLVSQVAHERQLIQLRSPTEDSIICTGEADAEPVKVQRCWILVARGKEVHWSNKFVGRYWSHLIHMQHHHTLRMPYLSQTAPSWKLDREKLHPK